jgi:4-hydroxy-tetrahydrodipicolinate reductase
MNIAIIGYGKMGKMIEKAARENGHNITAIVDPMVKEPGVVKSIDDAEIDDADAAIEFTVPGTAIANINALAKKKIPVVVGTTGWYDKLDEVKKNVDSLGASLIWSSNFSIGVNIFYRIAWYAAKLLDSSPEYDIGGFEAHHNGKLDSPSGTARTLVEGVLLRTTRKKKPLWETINRRPEADELHFPSLRLGSVTGRHSLFFDSPADTIEISHNARSREGFASGAIRAARWLTDQAAKGRRGVFTVDEMLTDILGI